MRPAPREPSKQLKAKSLPATKRRAASGLRVSAHAKLAASKVATTTANRAIIPIPSPVTAAAATVTGREPYESGATLPDLGQQILNAVPNLNHDATANAALGKPGLARHGRKLSPIEVARQPLPRRSPIGNRTHDCVDAEK